MAKGSALLDQKITQVIEAPDILAEIIALNGGVAGRVWDIDQDIYKMEEILARQSPEVRHFLLNTSILDQLTASLCDILLAEDSRSTSIRPSADILEELVQAILFIFPLDQEHRWYCYHHLFSDLLRLLLEKTSPGFSRELHRRACDWYETQGMIPADRAFVYNAQGDLSKIITHAKLANELLPSDDIAVKAMNLALWGKTISLYMHYPGGIPLLEQALNLAFKAQRLHVAMITAGSLALALLFAGKMHEVHRVCPEALEAAEAYQKRYHQPIPAAAYI